MIGKTIYYSFDFVHPYEGPLAVKWLPNDIIKSQLDKLNTLHDSSLNEVKQYLKNAIQINDTDKMKMWKKMKSDIVNFDLNRQQSYVNHLHKDVVEFLDSIKKPRPSWKETFLNNIRNTF